MPLQNVTPLRLLLFFLLFLGIQWPPSSNISAAPPPGNLLADEIIIYNWEGDIPQSVLDAFTFETGVKISYQVFNSQEEAIVNIRAGNVYDVAIIDGRFISMLTQKSLLKPLNYENLLNFKYISPNFRGLAYDPDNRFSVPYSWGTTGLLINIGIEHAPVHSWADLWDKQYTGRVAVSASYPREAIGLTLKALGYSANSENPDEVEAALAKLLQLRLDPTYLYCYYPDFGMATMMSGKVLIAVGFSGDLLESQKKGLSVEYILPEEGLLLWGDTFVVPASSRNQNTAELFIDFLLRPKISAEIVNQKYYASTNEAARPFVHPRILANTAIYPTDSMLMKAEIIEALSPEGQRLLDATWQKFLAAYPQIK
ncbi:MAG: spermidine/putrescine ABC transporter substrate-binding protein [Proteobacteria bacterium]|nr:spermidine/putrescine ABC transporter substrate-binding protein [Pseudomonadota bacterium]